MKTGTLSMAINFLLMVDFSVLLLTFCFEKSTNVSGKFSALWYFFQIPTSRNTAC